MISLGTLTNVSTWFISFVLCCFFFNDTATTEIYTLSLHDALPILKLMPQKRWAVFAATLGMAAPFALLSVVWASGV